MKLQIEQQKIRSSLTLDEFGLLNLHLFQIKTEQIAVGKHNGMDNLYQYKTPTAENIDSCKALLASTAAGGLTVMSFHPGLAGLENELLVMAKDRTIVGLGGDQYNQIKQTYIATGNQLHLQTKISLSAEDKATGGQAGNTLNIFTANNAPTNPPVIWAVLNCHDYTHVDLIKQILANKIELLIVVNANPATKLYWQYAMADMHRLFCFVVIANVAELGGSAVFAPFSKIGAEKHAQINVNGNIFGASGAGEFQVNLPLDIGTLRKLRDEFATQGFAAKASQNIREIDYEPMAITELDLDGLHNARPKLSKDPNNAKFMKLPGLF